MISTLEVTLYSIFFSTFMYGHIYSLYVISPIQPYLILDMNMTIMEYNILYSSPYWLRWLSNGISGYFMDNRDEVIGLIFSSFIILLGQCFFVFGIMDHTYSIAFFGRLINGLNYSRLATEYLVIHYCYSNIPLASNILGIMRAIITIIVFITTEPLIQTFGITYFLLLSIIPSIFSVITSFLYIPLRKKRIILNSDQILTLKNYFDSIALLPFSYWLFLIPCMSLTIIHFIIISNITLLLCEVYNFSIETANYYALVQSIIYIIFGIPIGLYLKKFTAGFIISSILALVSSLFFLYNMDPLIAISMQGFMLLILNTSELTSMLLFVTHPKVDAIELNTMEPTQSTEHTQPMEHTHPTEHTDIELNIIEPIASEPIVSEPNELEPMELEDNELAKMTNIGVATGLKEAIRSIVLFIGFICAGWTIKEQNSDGMISFDFTNFFILNIVLSVIALVTSVIFLIYV